MKLRTIISFLLTIIWFALGGTTGANAQTDSAHWKYIEKYARLAVSEMYYSRIPASITMAQALHESRYGTSELAVNANNHFGIKCQTGWEGGRYTYKDDDDNTCFRKYDSISQSYRDHSDFLMTRPRYAFLFELDPHDYKSWAHGLKQAGYATNPNYAPVLIRLIEDYNLYLLDSMQPEVEPIATIGHGKISVEEPVAETVAGKVFHRNRVDFVIAGEGETINSLTRKLDLLNWEIRKYNEIPRNRDLKPGQLVYIQPKRRQAESGYTFHVAEKGETMHEISQMYGVKLNWLYKRNRMKPGSQPKAGQEVWLRGYKPKQGN